MKKIEVGSIVPHFSLPDQDGNIFDISSVLGKKTSLYTFTLKMTLRAALKRLVPSVMNSKHSRKQMHSSLE